MISRIINVITYVFGFTIFIVFNVIGVAQSQNVKTFDPSRLSASLQAELASSISELPKEHFYTFENKSLYSTTSELTKPIGDYPNGLTVYLKESNQASIAELKVQLEKDKAILYDYSEQGQFFRVENVTGVAFNTLLYNDSIHFLEEGFTSGIDPVIVPFNENAQDTHQVKELKIAYKLKGTGIVVGVWDGGAVFKQHIEFDKRITPGDSASIPRVHATHVAGTIGAKGLVREAQGMAPSVKIISYDWGSDINEMFAAKLKSVTITNHSYGNLRGWFFNRKERRWEWHGDPKVSIEEDYMFGKYGGKSLLFDMVVYKNPKLSVFKSAGNDRGINTNNPNSNPNWNKKYYLPHTGEWSKTYIPADLWDNGGFDTLGDSSVGKNVITVGAIEDIIDVEPKPVNISVSSFSSWGPCDDGRIKPDLVANGSFLLSPTVTRRQDGEYYTDRYTELSGTSMASPTATGIGALLSELSIKKKGRSLYADEMKAALIHTAISPTKGPNYRTGWGSIRADWAGDLVAGKAGSLKRLKLGNEPLELIGKSEGNKPIRVTLVWIDYPGEPSSKGLDDRTPELVNDIDLTLISPEGNKYYPWSLDPEHPDASATRNGPNKVDNVERVDVVAADAKNGEWVIKIDNANDFMTQDFAIAIIGLQMN